MSELERQAISGELFSPLDRSSSPFRTPSPDGSEGSGGWSSDDGDAGRNPISFARGRDDATTTSSSSLGYGDASQSIGMGDGRTGVKGVIRDRAEANEIGRWKRAREVEEARLRMEKASLGGKTFLEEEEEKEEERAKGEGRIAYVPGAPRRLGRFGHLREVDMNGFVGAIEKEERGVWVVVHLYDASVDRCCELDETLSRLARVYPDTKFLHARASSLHFALRAKEPERARRARGIQEEGEEADGLDGSSEDEDEPEVDTDMLPTMLVYQGGELVHNWVRVDWEAGKAGIEELLIRHRIVPQGFLGGDVEFDDDGLTWSDEETK